MEDESDENDKSKATTGSDDDDVLKALEDSLPTKTK